MEQLERPPYLHAYTGNVLTDIKIHYLRQWNKEILMGTAQLEQLQGVLRVLRQAGIGEYPIEYGAYYERQARHRIEIEYGCLAYQCQDLQEKYYPLYRSLMENPGVGSYVSYMGISAALAAPDPKEETFAEWQRKSVSH